MKRLAIAVVGLALTVGGSGCCGCLSHMFQPQGYGGGCGPCGQAAPMQMMPMQGGCPNGACGYGPMGYSAPIGNTAMAPTYGSAPMFASVNPNPAF